jgi:hypothetical protein
MHGLSHAINFTRILAIDLGKFNSVACVYDPQTHAHSFSSLRHRRCQRRPTRRNRDM